MVKTIGPESTPFNISLSIDPEETTDTHFVKKANEATVVGVLKEHQCLKDPAPVHPDHANVQKRL